MVKSQQKRKFKYFAELTQQLYDTSVILCSDAALTQDAPTEFSISQIYLKY